MVKCLDVTRESMERILFGGLVAFGRRFLDASLKNIKEQAELTIGCNEVSFTQTRTIEAQQL